MRSPFCRRQICILLWVALSLGAGATAAAQEAFVAGSAGVCTGAGTTGSFGVSAGYLMSKRFGLEVEFGVTPDVEREIYVPTIQNLRNIPEPFASIFPPLMIDRSGTLYSFHSNVIVPHCRAAEAANLRRRWWRGCDALGASARASGRVRASGDSRAAGHSWAAAGPGLPGITFPAIDVAHTQNHTGLSLTAGGIVDVPVTQHLAIGVDVRYQHVFLSDLSLDLARISGRVRWRF